MSHTLIILLKLGGMESQKKTYNISNSQETDYGIALVILITGCCEIHMINKQL